METTEHVPQPYEESIYVTKSEIIAAFKMWNEDVRNDPESRFAAIEDVNEMPIDELSRAEGGTLMGYLRKVTGEEAS